MLLGVVDPDYQGGIGLPLHNEGKKDNVWDAGDPSSYLLVLPYPVMKVNGKLQHSNTGRLTKGTNMSGMKAWVILTEKKNLLEKNQDLLRFLPSMEEIQNAKVEEIEEGKYKHQIMPFDKL